MLRPHQSPQLVFAYLLTVDSRYTTSQFRESKVPNRLHPSRLNRTLLAVNTMRMLPDGFSPSQMKGYFHNLAPLSTLL
jgi:hypothetical protein